MLNLIGIFATNFTKGTNFIFFKPSLGVEFDRNFCHEFHERHEFYVFKPSLDDELIGIFATNFAKGTNFIFFKPSFGVEFNKNFFHEFHERHEFHIF
jgi:hypothetical protein